MEGKRKMANFCSECGAPLNGGNFCSECGAKAEDTPIQVEKKQPDNPYSEIDFERGYSIYGKSMLGLTNWVSTTYGIPRSEAKKLCNDFLETKKDEKAPNLFKRAWNQANDEIRQSSTNQNNTIKIENIPLIKRDPAEQRIKENKQIYEKTWFIIFLLIFFFPVGLFLMWKYSHWSKAVKVIVTILIGLMVIFTIVSDNSENNDIGEYDSYISVGSNDSSTQPVKTVSESVQLLMNEGLSESEANAIMSDLNSVGIKELISLKKGSGEGVDKLQAYAFSSESVSGLLTIENRKTYYIGTGNIDLFDSTKGGKLDDVTRYIISTSEKYMFMSDAENYVKQGLKAPSTADFPSQILSGDWKVNRKDDVVTVSSYVDAQNSFGAMIRSNFVVQISYSTGSCLYLEIDGQAMYGTYHN